MTGMTLDQSTRDVLLVAQRDEITGYHIYNRLAESCKDAENAKVLRRIAADEERHYGMWKKLTGQDVAPSMLSVRWYILLARVLGLTFSIKLMERGEAEAQQGYDRLGGRVPDARKVMADEDEHEDQLIGMIDEERLRYVGSMVLGLNDALVELTGALAGFTLAMQNARLIGTAGLITGIAASLSMAASEYLATTHEESDQDPIKASLYTGSAYVLTVILLILPYFILPGYLGALAWTMANAMIIILLFNYYISVARDMPFKRRFLEMAGISLGVALLSFGIGYVVGEVFQIPL